MHTKEFALPKILTKLQNKNTVMTLCFFLSQLQFVQFYKKDEQVRFIGNFGESCVFFVWKMTSYISMWFFKDCEVLSVFKLTLLKKINYYCSTKCVLKESVPKMSARYSRLWQILLFYINVSLYHFLLIHNASHTTTKSCHP